MSTAGAIALLFRVRSTALGSAGVRFSIVCVVMGVTPLECLLCQDGDFPRLRGLGLGQGHGQDAVLEGRADLLAVHFRRNAQDAGERSLLALRAVVGRALRRLGLALALDR